MQAARFVMFDRQLCRWPRRSTSVAVIAIAYEVRNSSLIPVPIAGPGAAVIASVLGISAGLACMLIFCTT